MGQRGGEGVGKKTEMKAGFWSAQKRQALMSGSGRQLSTLTQTVGLRELRGTFFFLQPTQ